MPFLLKKILSGLLLPLPISLICIALGLLFWLCCRGRKAAATFIIIGFVILGTFSLRYVPTRLLTQLESQYHPLTHIPTNVRMIVVLGGGVRGNIKFPPNTQLGSASLSRLVEGLRLFFLMQQRGRHPLLVLSGGRVFGSPSEAGTLRNTALILGVNPRQIRLEGGSQNTYQEARYLKRIVHQRPFLLVTSAFHMPRSVLLFKAQGMHPIAAPTQYLARSARYTAKYFLPSAVNLLHSDIAIHEYLGILWAHLSGHLVASKSN